MDVNNQDLRGATAVPHTETCVLQIKCPPEDSSSLRPQPFRSRTINGVWPKTAGTEETGHVDEQSRTFADFKTRGLAVYLKIWHEIFATDNKITSHINVKQVLFKPRGTMLMPAGGSWILKDPQTLRTGAAFGLSS